MARGESGRLVIEVDPEFKTSLYSVLARNGTTLKDWFIASALRFVEEQMQPSLFTSGTTSAAEARPVYSTVKKKKGRNEEASE